MGDRINAATFMQENPERVRALPNLVIVSYGKSIEIPPEVFEERPQIISERRQGSMVIENEVVPVVFLSYINTTRGKKVVVSESGSENGQNEDPCSDLGRLQDTLKKPQGDVPPYPFFSTAGGKKVIVSEEGIRKAQQKFGDESDTGFINGQDEYTDGEPEVPRETIKKPQEVVPPYPFFSTAGGKKVTVSEETLRKARQKFGDEFKTGSENGQMEDSKLGGLQQTIKKPQDSVPPYPFFSTAGGNKVVVSEEAMRKARQRMEDVTTPDKPFHEAMKKPQDIIPPYPFFTTAGGKKVVVSEESLRKARQIIEDVNAQDEGLREATKKPQEVVPPITFVSTIGEKKVVVSEAEEQKFGDENLAGSKHGQEGVSDSDLGGLQETIKKPQDVVPPCAFFSTAEGKKVVVSEEAIRKAQQKIHDEIETGPEHDQDEDEEDSEPLSPVFNATTYRNRNTAPVVMKLTASGDNFDSGRSHDSLVQYFLERRRRDHHENEEEWNPACLFFDVSTPPSTKLSSIAPGTVLVPQLKMVVARTYPVLYSVLLEGGVKRFLNEKAFLRHQSLRAQKKEKIRQILLPGIEQKIRHNLIPKPGEGNYKRGCLKSLSAHQILALIYSPEGGVRVAAEHRFLSSTKQKEVHDLKMNLEDKIRTAIEKELMEKLTDLGLNSSISRVLKVRVMDELPYHSDQVCSRNAVLSIWNPQSDLIDSLKETNVYQIRNLKPNLDPFTSTDRLSSTKESQYEPLDKSWTSELSGRKYTPISEVVLEPEKFKPIFEEFDTVGRISAIDVVEGSTQSVLIHLTDETETVLKVKFFTSIKASGFDDVLKLDEVVCCYNLHWQLTSPQTGIAFAVCVSVFSTQRKQDHLADAYDKLLAVNMAKAPTPNKNVEDRQLEDIRAKRMNAKRRFTEQFEDSPLAPLQNPAPLKRGRLSNSKFVPPRRVESKKTD